MKHMKHALKRAFIEQQGTLNNDRKGGCTFSVIILSTTLQPVRGRVHSGNILWAPRAVCSIVTTTVVPGNEQGSESRETNQFLLRLARIRPNSGIHRLGKDEV